MNKPFVNTKKNPKNQHTMKTAFQFSLLLGLCSCAFFLTGCMHGETFAEWKAQMFDKDPMSALVIPPNDTITDANGLAVYQQQKDNLEARKEFNNDVKLVPSSKLHGFIGNSGSRQQFAKRLSSRIYSTFNSLSDFTFSTLEEDVLEGTATAVDAEEENNINLFVYNIVALDMVQYTTSKIGLDGRTRTYEYYRGNAEVTLTLLDPEGNQRLYLPVSVAVDEMGTDVETLDALANVAAQELLTEFSRQTAPLAFVSEVRGNGLFAKISQGKDYGIQQGGRVSFYSLEPVMNPLTGQMENRQTVLASGVALVVGPDYAWIKVDLFHYRKVHIGTLVSM